MAQYNVGIVSKNSEENTSNSNKLCQKCLKENPLSAEKCSCGSYKFEPEFVKRIGRINRQFSVQVTEVAEQFREKGKPYRRLTLYKWWPGGKSSLNINRQEDWEEIKRIIDKDLGPFLNWQTKEEILKDFNIGKNKDSAKVLAESHPKFVNKIIKNIDFTKINEEDLPQVSNAIDVLINALQNADESFVIAIKKLIKQLPTQGKKAVEELSELLQQWSLRQVTAISTEVKYRLETIDIFNKAILDDKTYEIRGEGSVHRILEKAMWIIDERYWLLHSNETLRTIVGRELEKKDKKYKDKRPDFVCGTIGNKMIIVEIKRPSHELKAADLEQLETYMLMIEQNSDGKYTFEGYLVGRKISDDLKKRLKFRGSQFKVKTYSDLIDDVKKRYTDFYKKFEK
jgi:hypothetical protein